MRIGQLHVIYAGQKGAYLGDEDDLEVLGLLLEEAVGDLHAGVGASEDCDGLGHGDGLIMCREQLSW